MLGFPTGAKILFCTKPVDFRKGFNGLCGVVESVFDKNVLDGHLFLFINRRRDRIKALWWEPGGLILWYKRLERGTIELPHANDNVSHVTIDATELAMLLGGVPLASSRRGTQTDERGIRSSLIDLFPRLTNRVARDD